MPDLLVDIARTLHAKPTAEAAAHQVDIQACKKAAFDGDLANVTRDVVQFRVSASQMVAFDVSCVMP